MRLSLGKAAGALAAVVLLLNAVPVSAQTQGMERRGDLVEGGGSVEGGMTLTALCRRTGPALEAHASLVPAPRGVGVSE